MSATQYFVRIRGRVSGPYDLAALEELVRKGRVSRFHEVSVDRANWTAADSLEVLFPAVLPTSLDPAPAQPTSAPAQGPPEPVEENADDGLIPLRPLDKLSGVSTNRAPQVEYYYSQRGQVSGPVSLADLESMAGSGWLCASDLIWQEGDAEWMRAGQCEALSSVIAGGAGPGWGASGVPYGNSLVPQQNDSLGMVLSMLALGGVVLVLRQANVEGV